MAHMAHMALAGREEGASLKDRAAPRWLGSQKRDDLTNRTTRRL